MSQLASLCRPCGPSLRNSWLDGDSSTGRRNRKASLSKIGGYRSSNIQAVFQTSGEALIGKSRGKLRLFLDTADMREWGKWIPTGAFHGVTTNPLLLERAGMQCTVENLANMTQEAIGFGATEVQIQSWGQSMDELLYNGISLTHIDPCIVVKVPATKEGLEAAHFMARRGIRVTMTAVYTPQQAMLAASIGAEYVAPYLGRMIDQGKDGESTIVAMRTIMKEIGSTTRILVASIRDVDQVTTLAINGVDTFALPPAIVEKMFFDQSTFNNSRDFQHAATRMMPNPSPSNVLVSGNS